MVIPQGTVIVVAGPGSGKTRSAQQLAEIFGCSHIVDEWDGLTPLPQNALVLTNVQPAGASGIDAWAPLPSVVG